MGNGPAAQSSNPSYAGDVSVREAWNGLAKDKTAQLVDVRTEAEWNFVGAPDLSTLSRSALFCQWQHFPGGGRNSNFVAETEAALARTGYRKGAALYFLCRSGGRSLAAAIALTATGYGPCFNLENGFEGVLDDKRHRGGGVGWKAEGLPWIQS